MKRILISTLGGVLIPLSLAGGAILIVEVLGLHLLEPLARLLLLAVAWPLRIFSRVFPQPSGVLLEGPSSAALVATIVLDFLVYALICYSLLVLLEKKKRIL
jgi:hypothetical protein